MTMDNITEMPETVASDGGETVIDFIVFETERLYCREFNIDDVQAACAYMSDEENTYFMPWGPADPDGVRSFIENKLADQIADPRMSYAFAVCLKENSNLIGTVSVTLDERRMQGTLGYILDKRYWGSGYASEAVSGMLSFCFTCLDLHRVAAVCDSKNTASEALMKRVLMRFEGEAKSAAYEKIGGRYSWRSEKHFAMLQKEFLNRLYESEQDRSGG